MSYTIEEKNMERQHLLSEFLAPLSTGALKNISLQKGARILDLGCGLGDTSLMLSRQFPETIITGLDQDGGLIEEARTINRSQNGQIQFEQGDANKLPFTANNFDFVFARYLLHHISNPLIVIEEMKRVCKQGGTIFAQEPDINFIQSYPESWAYPQMREFTRLLFADPLLGRKLIRYFNLIQLENIESKADVILGTGNHAMKRFLTLTAEAQRSSILKNNLLEEDKLDELILECRRLEEDPDTIILSNPIIAVWGRKRF